MGTGNHPLVRTIRKDELIRLLLAGFMLKECANRLRISYHTVCKYARGPEFLEELRQVSEDVWRRVDEELTDSKSAFVLRAEEASEDALVAMRNLLESQNEHIVYKAAQDLMDRDPRVSRTRRIEGTGTPGQLLDVDALANAVKVIREEDRARGLEPPTDVIDAAS